MSVSVLLVDSHRVFREGLRELIDGNNDIKVIADVANVDDAVRFATSQEVDIAIVDVFSSRTSTEDMITRITQENKNTAVIVLSATSSQRNVYRAMSAGAAGYVSKSACGAQLLEAIETVKAGDRYLCSEIRQCLVDSIGISAGPCVASANALTKREHEVLGLIAEGLSSKEIATQLGLCTNTIVSHRQKLMNKLGIHKTANLVHFAIREGIATA